MTQRTGKTEASLVAAIEAARNGDQVVFVALSSSFFPYCRDLIGRHATIETGTDDSVRIAGALHPIRFVSAETVGTSLCGLNARVFIDHAANTLAPLPQLAELRDSRAGR